MKKKFLIIIFLLLVWASLTILAVSWGIRYDWPDNVHIDYGLPLVWATHTTSTIIGPVNIWTVNIPSLITDLSLWIGTMIIATAIIFYVRQTAKNKNSL